MKKSIIFIFLFIPLYIFSGNLDELRFEIIDNKNGLSHNTVRCIMQDKRGFMWIGTINGLNRYDGKQVLTLLPEYASSSLSDSKIKNMLEDREGYLWIHTTTGIIDCYDPRLETFIEYTADHRSRTYERMMVASNGDVWLWGSEDGCCRVRHVAGKLVSTVYDRNDIRTGIVNFVFEDSGQQVWIGTDKGLLLVTEGMPVYCMTGENAFSFYRAVEAGNYLYFITTNEKIVLFDRQNKNYLRNMDIRNQSGRLAINEVEMLDDKRILVTGKYGCCIFDTSTQLSMDIPELNGIKAAEVNILTDNKQNCWLYNYTGNIWYYKKDEQAFRKINLIPPAILAVTDLERYSVYQDTQGIVWITTYGNGLFAFDSRSGEITHFTTYNSGLKTNYLLSVTEDKTGNIWVGTEYTGVAKISLINYKNRVFFPDPERTGAADRIIRMMYEDAYRNVWIGTKGGTMYCCDEDLNLKQTYTFERGMPYFMVEDTVGNKWVATKGNGVMVFPAGEERFDKPMVYNNASGCGLTSDNLFTVFCDRKGNMWVGSFEGGLFLAHNQDGKITFKKILSISNRQRYIRTMMQDDKGYIWIGGNNGIIIMDPEVIEEDANSFLEFTFDHADPSSLSNNEVKAFLQAPDGRIWVGTSGGGLNLVILPEDYADLSFRHYTSGHGLMNNVIQTMLLDKNGHIWIGTESGISKFDPVTEGFENYSFSDTWEGDLFCEAASVSKQNGELVFGTYNGIHIFNPDFFVNASNALPVILTGFEINGSQVVPALEGSPLTHSISETKSVVLKNTQNSFNIAFSSLNFHDSYSDRYTYILENYEKRWNPGTQYNVAAYRNIPPGKYIFRVKARSGSGNWNEQETTLQIIVAPAFWKSSRAIALYFLLILIAGFFAIKLMLKMNRLHNEVEIEKQLTEYRLRFFTNISHEFRTPLTIIQGTIENLKSMESLGPVMRRHIKTLDSSSARLMRLIVQLLEFRKIQNNHIELKPAYMEVVSFMREIYVNFAESAEKKKIDYRFVTNAESAIILLDAEKADKIGYNLLSNAFKHVPENGRVELKLNFDYEEKIFTLSVSDSGKGVPPDKRELLFKRFSQIDYSTAGIGIGLHLTSELVKIHKGEIEYTDSEWGGACFCVYLPFSEEIYEEERTGLKESKPELPVICEEEPEEITEDMLTRVTPHSPYKILIVEDDDEIVRFLLHQLEKYFTVLTAPNGKEGFELAVSGQPDLIICDVMMPEMDGFELTRRLKTDFESSHIPIVLLTAYSSPRHQLEGINAGADAYIVKPFSINYLVTRVAKLIEQRKKLQKKFAHDPATEQSAICTITHDQEFMHKLHTVLQKELDNPDFSVDDFARSLHLGRSVFYKKVKGITGYSPKEYLRIMRMKEAARLLAQPELNISEISYKVGFNDPFYFSKCFKEQFGVSPTQFRDKEVT